jgi:predicted HTH transcriptional regulator
MTTHLAETVADLQARLVDVDALRERLTNAIALLQSFNGHGARQEPARTPRAERHSSIPRPMARARVLQLLRERPRTARELCAELQHSRHQMQRALTRLLREGKVVRLGAARLARYGLPGAADAAKEAP